MPSLSANKEYKIVINYTDGTHKIGPMRLDECDIMARKIVKEGFMVDYRYYPAHAILYAYLEEVKD